MLSEETKSAILKLQTNYPEKRSALLPALHLAQAEKGFLSRETQNEIAVLFGLDPNEVNSVVSFYDMFFDQPIGKHIIHVCKNISCMLRGSDQLLEGVCHKLQIKPGETTKDGEFTVVPSECLAACDLAPMMIADERVIGPVKAEDLDEILAEVKKGPGHPSPVEKVAIEQEINDKGNG